MLFASVRIAVTAVLVYGLKADSCQFKDGDAVTLLSDNGNYLARCSGCVPRGSYGDSAFVHVSGSATAPGYAKWKVYNTGNGKLAFQGSTGKYLARCNNCSPTGAYPDEAFVHVSNWADGPYAQWTCEDIGDGKIALKSDTGKYLARCNNCLSGAPYSDAAFIHATTWVNQTWAQWKVTNLAPRLTTTKVPTSAAVSTTTTASTSTPTPTTTQSPVVTLWADDFRGSSKTFGPGSYNLDGDLLNSVSSLQVAPGYQVLLFDQLNQQGNIILYGQDVLWPQIGSWNDRAQSIRIFQFNVVLTVWRDDYQGVFRNFNLGGFNMTGDFLNSISSLKLSPGYMVTLYDQPNLQGDSITYKSDVSYSSIGTWNDRAQSILVDRIPTTWTPYTYTPTTTPTTTAAPTTTLEPTTTPAPTTTPFVPPVVTLWTADFNGASQGFGPGAYNLKGELLNTVSSLNISSGYQITLFDQNNQRGNNITYGVDVPWQQIGGWNDRAKSILVAPSSVVLTVWKDDYQGAIQSFGVGDYNLEGDLFNTLSSLKLAANYQVTLYDRPNQAGKSKLFTTDVPWPSIGTVWNDKAQSITVERLHRRCDF
ncbi:hypothetical protein LEN26_014362 [Aphanomyces euteiches]|nr:hypothetical protein LEN26_014362 [Aphanomyces euteiches]KAH9115180.1 hypothetical protein AeMF1_010763 [Aphanomyces euteiches]KAH9192131.1 hypothetical protein AeNC1_005894 [Aphanomyces euteiches]